MVGSLNRGQWDPVADFAVTKTKVWLSEPGRKKAIRLFEDRMQETWKHPVLNYSLSCARSIELEARLLEKECTGDIQARLCSQSNCVEPQHLNLASLHDRR